MVGKGLPIIEATEPYAFHLESANDFQSSDDYLNTVHFSDTCENSLEGTAPFFDDWLSCGAFSCTALPSPSIRLQPNDLLRHNY